MTIAYVLTHEYSDKSAFSIHGVTEHYDVAVAWNNASDETRVYTWNMDFAPQEWRVPTESWPKGSKKEKP